MPGSKLWVKNVFALLVLVIGKHWLIYLLSNIYNIYWFVFFLIYDIGKKRGSAIAKIVGKNAHKYPQFETDVRMYVYEEIVDGRKLSEIINEQHENVKYLPGHKLPENIVSWDKWKKNEIYYEKRSLCLPIKNSSNTSR